VAAVGEKSGGGFLLPTTTRSTARDYEGGREVKVCLKTKIQVRRHRPGKVATDRVAVVGQNLAAAKLP
jgi:hypothetical protein